MSKSNKHDDSKEVLCMLGTMVVLFGLGMWTGCDQPPPNRTHAAPADTACHDEGADIGTGGYAEFKCPHPDHIASLNCKGYMICNCKR